MFLQLGSGTLKLWDTLSHLDTFTREQTAVPDPLFEGEAMVGFLTRHSATLCQSLKPDWTIRLRLSRVSQEQHPFFSLFFFKCCFHVAVLKADSLQVCWNCLKIEHNSQKNVLLERAAEVLWGENNSFDIYKKEKERKERQACGLGLNVLCHAALCIGMYFAYLLSSSLRTSNLAELEICFMFLFKPTFSSFLFGCLQTTTAEW